MRLSPKVLVRRLLHGGATGDAASAGGRTITWNVIAQLSAQAVSMIGGVITVALTARTLGASAFGVFSSMSAYVGIFAILTEIGVTNTAILRMSAEPEREAEWLGALVGIRTILSIGAAIVCAVSIPLLLTNANDGHLVGLIMTFGILLAGPQAFTTVFQARLRAGLLFTFNLLQSLLWQAAVIALAILHASIVAFAVTNVAILVALAVLQVQATRHFAHIAWRRGRTLWRLLLRMAVPLGLALAMITVYYQIDAVLLLQISGPREAGVYGAAYRFLNTLTSLPALVMMAFFPVMSAARRNTARIGRLVQICLDLMAVISLPFLAATIALPSQIIAFVYGSEFHHAAGLLPILMLAFVAISYGNVSGYLAPVLDLQWRFAIYSTFGMVINIVLNLILIPSYGAYGSAWATVATEFLAMLLMMSTGLRALRIRVAFGNIERALLVAAATAGVMALLAVFGLFPALAAGALVYIGGVLVLGVIRPADLRSLRKTSTQAHA